jgi:hypothetical protein
MASTRKPTGRVLRGLRHGGEVLPDGAPGAKEAVGTAEGVSLLSTTLPVTADERGLESVEFSTPFDYLFSDLAAAFPTHHLSGDPAAVTAALKQLGERLIESPPQGDPLEPDGNGPTPPVYTYWGQFIDHDITANTDRQNMVTDLRVEVIQPVAPATVVADLRNLRQPALNLDSLYGDGPSFDGEPATVAAPFYDGPKMKIGAVAEVNNDGSALSGDHVADDADRDLPREGSKAQIGDDRNDENLIVAQLHVAFLRFHNAVVDWLRSDGKQYSSDRELFDAARTLVRRHYQWLVVNDYLRTITLPGVLDRVLVGGNRFFTPPEDAVYMPVEFSVAAYRFGHSMVRFGYDYNRNFGRDVDGGPGKVIPFAPFGLIFAFTGGAQPEPFTGATTVLPFNWVIEWDRFVDKGSSTPDHFARKIDTRLTEPLSDMINQITKDDENLADVIKNVLKALAVRNLLRGYQLSLPTGQAVATALGVVALTAEELQRGNSDHVTAALVEGGFLEETPLWFYILKESEVRANGNFLGEVGSRIVVETLVGQLRADRESYLNAEDGWTPDKGVRLPDGELLVTIGDLFRFAGVLPARP